MLSLYITLVITIIALFCFFFLYRNERYWKIYYFNRFQIQKKQNIKFLTTMSGPGYFYWEKISRQDLAEILWDFLTFKPNMDQGAINELLGILIQKEKRTSIAFANWINEKTQDDLWWSSAVGWEFKKNAGTFYTTDELFLLFKESEELMANL